MPTTLFLSEEFLTYSKVYLKDCPNAMIALHLKLAAREFFQRTRIWTLDQGGVNVVANQATYAAAGVPTGAEPCGVRRLQFKTKDIGHLNDDELRATYGDDWLNVTNDVPAHYTLDDEATVRLVPKPTANATAALDIKWALRPSLAATGIDEKYFLRWGPQIGAGAVAKLQRVPDKPYSRPDDTYYQGQFDAGISDAKWEDEKRHGDREVGIDFRGLVWR